MIWKLFIWGNFTLPILFTIPSNLMSTDYSFRTEAPIFLFHLLSALTIYRCSWQMVQLISTRREYTSK